MSCITLSAEVHRRTCAEGEDAYVLAELHRAWINPGDRGWDCGPKVVIDWSHFRAIMLREVRRRGLTIPTDVRAEMIRRGVGNV